MQHRKKSLVGRQRLMRAGSLSREEQAFTCRRPDAALGGERKTRADPSVAADPSARPVWSCRKTAGPGRTFPARRDCVPCPYCCSKKGRCVSPPPRPGGRCCVCECVFKRGLLVSLCWHRAAGRTEGWPICWWQSCLIAVRDRHPPPRPRPSGLGPSSAVPAGPCPPARARSVRAGAPLAFLVTPSPSACLGAEFSAAR